jgi:arylsulfatase A-like enzyme/lipoprotein NlpI
VKVYEGVTEQMFDVFTSLNRSPYFKKQPDGSLRHLTEITGDHAIKFIESNEDGTPFCLSVSFNASHAEDGDKENQFPYPPAMEALYKDVKMPAPRYSPELFENQPEVLKNSMNRDRFFWRWDTPEKYEMNMRNYLRMISGIDMVIGRVLDAVEKKGLAENTVVIYMADNGYYAASRGFAGKWSHFEESQRVPLVVYDPRLDEAKRGKVLSPIALNLDIAPTLLSYAGVALPEGYQGLDLKPLVEGAVPVDWRTDFFCEHRMDNARIPKWEGVRGERYKYARYYEQKPVYEALIDLESDPAEMKNFINDPSYSDTLKALRARTNAFRDACVSQAKADSVRLLEKATYAFLGHTAAEMDAAGALSEALALDPANLNLRVQRIEVYEKSRRFAKAADDLTVLLEANPDSAALLQQRGINYFFSGDMKRAIADFDRYIELRPGAAPHHWQRGLAYYYAEKFEKGKAQFEIHQDVNSNDVENAAWHFLCVARLDGVDKARKQLIPIKGDSRVPMKEVLELFAGTGTEEDVLKASEAVIGLDEKTNSLCYAHLYLGLYYEAIGDAEKSKKHIKLSADNYAQTHYMGETARVHQLMRKPKEKKKK